MTMWIQHNPVWVGGKFGCAFNCMWSVVCWGRQNLSWVALEVSFSGFHSGRHLSCSTDWIVMLISRLLWGICSSLDSGLPEAAIKVGKSHQVTYKALNLKCVQSLIFSRELHVHQQYNYQLKIVPTVQLPTYISPLIISSINVSWSCGKMLCGLK